MKVLITQTHCESGHEALCIAPLSQALLNHLNILLFRFTTLKAVLPDLVSLRTSNPRGMRMVIGGKSYKRLQKRLGDREMVVCDLSARTLKHLTTMPTELLDLVTFEGAVKLVALAGHDGDEYTSMPLNAHTLGHLSGWPVT